MRFTDLMNNGKENDSVEEINEAKSSEYIEGYTRALELVEAQIEVSKNLKDIEKFVMKLNYQAHTKKHTV